MTHSHDIQFVIRAKEVSPGDKAPSGFTWNIPKYPIGDDGYTCTVKKLRMIEATLWESRIGWILRGRQRCLMSQDLLQSQYRNVAFTNRAALLGMSISSCLEKDTWLGVVIKMSRYQKFKCDSDDYWLAVLRVKVPTIIMNATIGVQII